MSLEYRYQRINKISTAWNLNKVHPLITSYKIPKDFFESFKANIKFYISKALKVKFNEDDKIFIKNINKVRNNRANVTPNGAVVPKREYNLEYNLVLRSWCELIRQMTINNYFYT